MLRSSDSLTKVFLFLIVVLLAAHLLVIAGPTLSVRAAGIPDTGALAQDTVDQLKDVNRKLDSLQKFLESGNITVKVKADKEEK